MKIRYFSFLSHRHKKRYIPAIRQLIDPKDECRKRINETSVEIMKRLTGMDISVCPKCGGQLNACPLPVEAESVQVAVLDTSWKRP